ncbi:cell division protein FtsQ/DivIB [Treponema sp. C6A8]|uniref:cell division protein FtsQ/DivIB n=1 Tax=Treponema sp. C6A8 TaxID=1410609 RepID=UPI000480FB14|nr:FtsQ-type POTRA domain-containing protein [Treponema sp. C6A8]
MSDLSLMLDDYLDDDKADLNEYFQDEDVADTQDDSADKKIKAIKIIFAILCFLLVAELVVYKYILPSFSSPKISVTGLSSYTPEDFAEKLAPFSNANWFDFDVDQAAAVISNDAGIDSVIVEKHFPDKILIKVEERKPVAMIFLMDNGISSALEIDKNGVIFPQRASEVSDNSYMPIISGLPVEYMAQGMRIPLKYRPLIDQIARIKSLPQQYFASVSEICVLPKDTGNYELALIPAQAKVKVLTDRSLNEEALKYMMIVLDVVNQLGSNVTEVDLRYGSVSYKTR